eukprot:GDKI01033164.1.p2 GENE.GDKI01033164.1~~GDKI01033164.1.p2  ORF type:complete len:252 (+),score=99.51 GDKI01033164.1:169-924(+)
MVRLTSAVLAALALSLAAPADALLPHVKLAVHSALVQTAHAKCSGEGECCSTTKCCSNSAQFACKAKVDGSYAECVERTKCHGKGWKCHEHGMHEDGSDASSDHSEDSNDSESGHSVRSRGSHEAQETSHKKKCKCDKSYWPRANLENCFWEHTEIRASPYFGEHDAETYVDCQKICLATEGCETFVWGDWKKCYLKGCEPNTDEGFTKVMFLDQTKNVHNGGGKFVSGPKKCHKVKAAFTQLLRGVVGKH